MEGLLSLLKMRPEPGSSMAVLGRHNPLLVILSFVIALFAVRAFLELSQHLLELQPTRRRLFWKLGAAVVLGGGIWSMHFTAILAYHPGIPVHFDWSRTGLSLMIPVVATLISLWLLGGWRRAVVRHRLLAAVDPSLPVLVAGLTTGLSLVVMHFVGMSALHMRAQVFYHPAYVWTAVALGVVSGVFTLWLASRRFRGDTFRHWTLAMIVAAALTLMHYLVMRGTEIFQAPRLTHFYSEHLFSRTILSVAIFATMTVLFLFLMVSIRVDRRLRQGDREVERLQGYLNAVVNSVRNYAIFMVNKDGLIKTWNTGATAIFYAPEAAALGSHLARFVTQGEELVKRANDLPAGVSRNLSALRADGTEFNAYIVLEPVFLDGECQGHGVFVQDLTHFLRTREQLSSLRDEARRFEFLANHDSLTGLMNRRAFLQEVTEKLAGPDAEQEYWLFLCDLDHFKVVNDHYGHDVGDQVLKVFAQRAQSLFGDRVPLGRFGGEEFMGLLQGDRETVAHQIQQLVRTMQATPVSAGSDVVPVTVSFGLAPCPPGFDPDLQIVIQQADAALYYAKSHGRNQAVFFELRVLLIEPEDAEALSERIKTQASMPVRVMSTRDGMQAISLAGQFNPHLLILRPPLTGIDIRRFLAWSETEFPELKIAVLGTLGDHENAAIPDDTLRLDLPLSSSAIYHLLAETARQAFQILPSRVPDRTANKG